MLLLRFALLPQLFRRVGGDECVKDLVHVAVQELVELVNRQLDAVVGHTIFREIIGADALRAVARADLTLAVGRDGGTLLFYLGLVQPRTQHGQRFFLVGCAHPGTRQRYWSGCA